MGRAQDWCLECGAAAPGRLGARPAGWRASITLVAATLLLVGGAVVASYAALTSDAEREAKRPSAGDGAPVVAQRAQEQPVAPAEPTGPGTEQQTARPNVPRPRSGAGRAARPAPVTPPAARSRPAAPAGPTKPPAPKVVGIDLGADSARTYDPYARPAAEFGSARLSTDGDPSTVWDVTLPADGESPRVGLTVDLDGAYALKSLKIATPTAGFTAEIYGTSHAGIPDDILDKRWTRLTNGRQVGDRQTIELDNRSQEKVRRVVIWLTAAADPEDPRVAIGELSLRGAK